MSEPNKSKTIPLHIADRAVAACEAEIQKLKEENARLKGEDYAYNELGSMVPRHLLEHWMHESARLKAEVEQIRKTVDEHLTPIPEHTTVREVERLCTAWSLMSKSLNAQWKRIEQLKAEVERLEPELEQRCRELNLSLGQQAIQLRQIGELKAEVERLTKLCQATSPDGFVHVRDIKHHPIMGPAWEERQKVANLIPPIVESNAIPEGKAVLVNIYQHQQDAEEIQRLKAEVERLTNENDNNSVMKEEWYLKCMSARSEVERLRKAGDGLEQAFREGWNMTQAMPEIDAWLDAKEGKPSV